MKSIGKGAILAAVLVAGMLGYGQMASAQLQGTCDEQMKQVQAEIASSTVQADKDAATASLAEAQAAAAANDDASCKNKTNEAHLHVHH